MKSVRFNLFLGVVFAIASLRMTVESVQRSEWFTAFLALFISGICFHSVWKDWQILRKFSQHRLTVVAAAERVLVVGLIAFQTICACECLAHLR